MADNKNKQDGRDRSKVAADQNYEVQHFADQHGLTPALVRELIARFGNDRATLEKAVEKIRRERSAT